MESTTSLDTTLDALSAQARAFPPLPLDEVDDLLAAARGEPRGAAAQTLIRHHLSAALDGALARAESGVDIGDLYQEGTVAVVTAVEEYAMRSGDAPGLRPYVERVVALYLDAAVQRDQEQRAADEAFVRDSRLYQTAEVALRHKLGRPATPPELAAALEWTPERVELIGVILNGARLLHDQELVEYLDDEELPAGEALPEA